MKRRTLLSIFVIASCVSVLEVTAIHGVQKATYQQAANNCTARGASLASTEQLRHQLQLVPNNVPLWLPYRKSMFGDWRWTDGEFYGKDIINPAISVPHQDCAVIHSSDRILDESYCFKPANFKDFLCDLPGSCPPGQTCITIDNKSRSAHYGKFSWFQARNKCRELGGDLATFYGKEMQLTIQSIHASLKRQGHFWIGLARKQWIASGEHQTYYNWTSNADDSLGCAIISHDFAWRTASCENQNAFICNVTKTEGSAVTEQTSIQETAAEKMAGWETMAHTDKVAVSEIPSSSNPDIGSAGAGTIVGIILLVIIVVLLLGFFVLRCFQVTRRQKEPPKNYRETVKKMVFYDKLCKRRDVMKQPNEAEQGSMDDQEVISTNKNPQDSARCSWEIEEPSPETPLMSACTEPHTVAVTNENGSTKDKKLQVRKRPDEADTVQNENALNEKCGNQAEPKPSLYTIKNGSKQLLKISDVASKNSVKSSKQLTADSQNDSSKAQKDPHLNTKDNLDEQSNCSNMLDEVQDTNMTDNSTIPVQKQVLTNPDQANTVRSQVAFNEKKENEAKGKPNLHTIKNGSNQLHKMSNVISDVTMIPSKQSTRDSTRDSSEEEKDPLLHVKDNLDKHEKGSNVNGKVEISSVKGNKATNRVDDITTGMQNLGINKTIPYAKENSMLTPNADQNSKSNLGQSLFMQVPPDGKQSKPSIRVTREENNIKADPSVSESNSHRISQYRSCVNEGQSTDSKEKNQTRKDREEAPTSHTTKLVNKKENEYNMAQSSPSKEGRNCELPSTQLIQTGKPPHSKANAEPREEQKSIMPCGKIQQQIHRQNVQEQKPDISDIHVPKSITLSHDVKDDLAKLSDQEFADLLKNYSLNKDNILVEYAKNPDVFHQKIDTVTTRLSNSLERPRLLHLLQQIAEDSPQVFLERHVRQVGTYVSKDSGDYPVLRVLKCFPTKFPDVFEIIDDAVINLFEKDGKKLFVLFPKLIGVLGSCSEKSARKYTKLLVRHFAVLPVPWKNNLLGCLAEIATHFKDVVLVHKDKFENIKNPLHDVCKNKLLEVLGVKSKSQGAQGEPCQGNVARTVNEEEKEEIRQKKGCTVEGEEIGENKARGMREIPTEKNREQNEGKHENEVKTKKEEDENVKPKVLASATKKGPAPLPPDTKPPPARPL